MSKLRELVGIVSFLSGKPRKAVAQAQVDDAMLLDLDGEMTPVCVPGATPDSPVATPDEKNV